jgi:hypothetical protein
VRLWLAAMKERKHWLGPLGEEHWVFWARGR